MKIHHDFNFFPGFYKISGQINTRSNKSDTQLLQPIHFNQCAEIIHSSYGILYYMLILFCKIFIFKETISFEYHMEIMSHCLLLLLIFY